MEKPEFLTAEGKKKLEEELAYLKGTKRAEMAEHLKYSLDFGDLSENAEYDLAKNEQGMVEGRILVLEDILKRAVIVGKESKNEGVIVIGTKVDGKDEFGKFSFQLTGSTEVNVGEGRISNVSPIGKALMGHKEGDKVKVKTPGGERELLITGIS